MRCTLACKATFPENLNVFTENDQVAVYAQNPVGSTMYSRSFTLSPFSPPVFNPANGVGYEVLAQSINLYSSAALAGAAGTTFSPTPTSTIDLSWTTGAFTKMAFDGAGHFFVLGQNGAPNNNFVVDTFNASAMSGVGVPTGIIDLNVSAPLIGMPDDIATDPTTNTVYVSDWTSGLIFELSSAKGPLNDNSTPICEISLPPKSGNNSEPVRIAYDGFNHLLYVLTKDGEVLAFQGCSSTPVRDITGVVAAVQVGYPWDFQTAMAADPVSGVVSVAVVAGLVTGNNQITVKSFAASDNGALTPTSFQVPGDAATLSYGP